MKTNYSLRTKNYELVAIVGPTASGKSDLAIRIAKQFDGEIISADSLTIYKGMDIATAKPAKADRAGIPHWGFDLVEPGINYSVYQFKKYALEAIKDIKSRGKLPVLVGGTGLYADAVLFDFGFRQPPDKKKRAELEKLSVEELQGIIHEQGLPMAKNVQNPRHLIRIIESGGQSHRRKQSLEPGMLLIGVLPPDEVLKRRISQRVEKMFKKGLIEETEGLLKRYGKDSILAKTRVAYGPVVEYLSGSYDMDEAKKKLAAAHWQFARRQKTYFKRNQHIQWFSSAGEAYKFIAQLLNN